MILKTIRELANDNDLSQTAIRYALGLASSKELNNVARECGVFPQLKVLKHTFLKGHKYTLSCFWKAITLCLTKDCKVCSSYKNCKQYSMKTNCIHFSLNVPALKTYGVAKEDVLFTLSFLKKKEKRLLIKKYAKRVNLTQDFSLNDICVSLYSWCSGLVRKKFSFILKYYNIDPEDIVHDLLAEGYVRALECDTITDQLLFTNTIKRRIKQRAVNLIHYYTTSCRQRICKLDTNKEEIVNRLAYYGGLEHLSYEEKENTFKNYINDFQVTCLSMDSKFKEDEEGSFHNILASTDDPTIQVEETELLATILKELPTDTYRRILKILVGHHDSEFATYIKDGNGESLTKILSFFSIRKKAFYDEIGKVLVKNNIVSEEKFKQLREA